MWQSGAIPIGVDAFPWFEDRQGHQREDRYAGGRVVGGLELLVEQAAEQVHLMTGHQPPVDAMRAAGEAVLAAPPSSPAPPART